MADASLEVPDVPNLQDFLLSTIRHVKTLHAILSAVMTDVAAIRRTLLEEIDDVGDYKSNLLSAIETAKPLVDEAMQSYDDMIRQLEYFEEWRN